MRQFDTLFYSRDISFDLENRAITKDTYSVSDIIRIHEKVLRWMMRTKGYVSIRVVGDSMAPVLNDGELVRIHRADNYCKGDVVLWCHPNGSKLFIHRIVARYRGELITKGDNMLIFDYPIKTSYIIGKCDCGGKCFIRMNALCHLKALWYIIFNVRQGCTGIVYNLIFKLYHFLRK